MRSDRHQGLACPPSYWLSPRDGGKGESHTDPHAESTAEINFQLITHEGHSVQWHNSFDQFPGLENKKLVTKHKSVDCLD